MSRRLKSRKNREGTGGGKKHNKSLDTMVWNAAELKDCTPNEVTLMKAVATTLNRHYPKPDGLPFWWAVETNHSVLNIFNLSLSGRVGYLLHVQGICDAKVINAGGEILERYGIKRTKYTANDILEKHHNAAGRFLEYSEG